MIDNAAMAELLSRWFATGDELAHRQAYTLLGASLYVPREALAVLGSGAIEELRQDVLSRLLDRTSGKLRESSAPLAYTRVAWRRELASALRKWGPRLAREREVREHVQRLAPEPLDVGVATRLDADRALRTAGQLEGKGRLAILLTTQPDRITDADWAALTSSLPPPPPPRPTIPLEREEASLLLYPPAADETTTERYQRLNSFDKTFKRAIAMLRDALGATS